MISTPRIRLAAVLLGGALLLSGCPSDNSSGDQSAGASRTQLEAKGAPGAKILVGFTPKAAYDTTSEAKVRPLGDDDTYFIDVRVVDDKTDELRTDVANLNITVTGPKGDQESKPAWDLRPMFGHFCEGFKIEPRKNYQVTVSYNGALNGAATLTFST